MSFAPGFDHDALVGPAGELVLVRVRIDSRQLDEVLEVLASADFPINPELRHGFPDTVVEFPAYSEQLDAIRDLFRRNAVPIRVIETASMLEAIA